MSYYQNFAENLHIKEKNLSEVEISAVQNEFEEYRNNFILNFISKKEKIKLLEIGSGKGSFAKKCRERKNIEYFGIEPEKKLYNSLKEKKYNIKQTFVPPIPFETEIFDIVCHFHVLEHMENSRQAFQFISECSRTLKKQGTLILRCPNILSWGMDFWDVDYTHSFPTSPTRVRQLLYDCNFKIIHFEELSFLKPRHFGKFRYFVPRKNKFLNKLYPKISKFLGGFIKKDTELIFICQKNENIAN
jgi:SAM-dependent methyltransferase